MVLFENVLTRCLIGAAIRYHWGLRFLGQAYQELKQNWFQA